MENGENENEPLMKTLVVSARESIFDDFDHELVSLISCSDQIVVNIPNDETNICI